MIPEVSKMGDVIELERIRTQVPTPKSGRTWKLDRLS